MRVPVIKTTEAECDLRNILGSYELLAEFGSAVVLSDLLEGSYERRLKDRGWATQGYKDTQIPDLRHRRLKWQLVRV